MCNTVHLNGGPHEWLQTTADSRDRLQTRPNLTIPMSIVVQSAHAAVTGFNSKQGRQVCPFCTLTYMITADQEWTIINHHKGGRHCYSAQNNQPDHNGIHKTKEQTILCGTAMFCNCYIWALLCKLRRLLCLSVCLIIQKIHAIPLYTGENDPSGFSICLSMQVLCGNIRVGSMSTSSCILYQILKIS